MDVGRKARGRISIFLALDLFPSILEFLNKARFRQDSSVACDDILPQILKGNKQIFLKGLLVDLQDNAEIGFSLNRSPVFCLQNRDSPRFRVE